MKERSNRPENSKFSIGKIAVMIVGALLVATVVIVVGNLFTSRLEREITPPKERISPQEKAKEVSPLKGAPSPATKEALTFYETLPKAEKVVVLLEKPTVSKPPLETKVLPKVTTTAKVTTKPAIETKEKAITPETPTAKKPVFGPALKPVEPYTVQVAAFKDLASAHRLEATLKVRGYSAYVAEADIPGKGKWYRVRIGSFAKESEANKLVQELRRKERLLGYVAVKR